MSVTKKLFKILSRHGFCIKCYCDLDIWPTYLKMYRVIYWPWPIFLPSTMTVTYKLFKILSGHGFFKKCYCDIDLWPSDLKMYRGHLLSMANLPTKYNDCHSETSRYWADMMWLTDGQTPYHNTSKVSLWAYKNFSHYPQPQTVSDKNIALHCRKLHFENLFFDLMTYKCN